MNDKRVYILRKTIERFNLFCEEWQRIGYRPNPTNIRYKRTLRVKIIFLAEQIIYLNDKYNINELFDINNRRIAVLDYLNQALPNFITIQQLIERDNELKRIS